MRRARERPRRAARGLFGGRRQAIIDLMPPRKRKPALPTTPTGAAELRIIGGKWRRRKLAYHGDLVTRPMKDRVREAMFNLIGPSVVGTHALDLFAGTGAL